MRVMIGTKTIIDDQVSKIIINLVNTNPKAVLGLATGSTPAGVYAALVNDHITHRTDYHLIKTINLDEYANLDTDHPNSYRTYMNNHLFDHINIRLEHTHFPDSTPFVASFLEQHPVNLQLLGIGNNGHIGFNEPGTPFESSVRLVSLSDDTLSQNARYFETPDQMPKKAYTLGISDILKVHQIILIATGPHKARIIKQMIEGPITPQLPASVLRRHPDVTVYLDHDAAALLDQSLDIYTKGGVALDIIA